MRASHLICLLAAAALAGPAAATESQATVGEGDGMMAATLLAPDKPVDRAAVLIIPGSGAIDRDGNSASLRTDTYRLLAEGLAARGVASLRYDKRGVGASRAAGVSEAAMTFETSVDDAVTWADLLRRQPHVRCVVLLGHSEGALVAALAAKKTPVCGVVEIAGGGRNAGDVIEGQLKAAHDGGRLPDDLYQQAISILVQLKAGQSVALTPPELAGLFRPSAQPYLKSWIRLDPVKSQPAGVPILVMQGTTDLQVGVGDARALAAGSKTARLVILDGVNHVLKTAPMDRAANVATYSDPNLPLAPGVISPIADFVAARRP